jgi:hypothetical protein
MPEKKDPAAVVWDWRRTAATEGQDETNVAAARKRGLIGGLVGLAIAAVVFYLWKRELGYVIAGVSLALALLALAAPRAYLKVMALLDRFAHAVGMAVTWLLMTLLYYLLFLPVGLLLRARGRLAVTKRPDRRLPSYWTSTEGKSWTAESYRKQF